MDQQTTFSNRTMQLASITSNKYKNHVQFYASELRSSALNALYKNSSKLKQSILPDSRLKVAWVIGDLCSASGEPLCLSIFCRISAA